MAVVRSRPSAGVAIGMVLMNALVGAGASRTSMVVSVSTQWLSLRMGYAVCGVILRRGGAWPSVDPRGQAAQPIATPRARVSAFDPSRSPRALPARLV